MSTAARILILVLLCYPNVCWAQTPAVQSDAAKLAQVQSAAAAGDVAAMLDLGISYANGRGVAQDYAAAHGWFEKAAAGGNADAMEDLGILYVNGSGVAQDYAAARGWYEKAVAKGSVRAMTNLGNLYAEGHGVAVDYHIAKDWYEKGAAGGDANAMTDLGVLYNKGLGVPRDDAAARDWFQKAAAGGDTIAMRYLGILYAQSQGLGQDYAAARGWYEKAAVAGDVDAMLALGVLCAKGQGAAQDDAAALDWFQKAAAGGNTKAMIDLGILYATGHGVEKNIAAAGGWYEAAAGGQAAATANRRVPSACATASNATGSPTGPTPSCTMEERIRYQSALVLSTAIGSGNTTCSGEVVTDTGIVVTANHCMREGGASRVLLGGLDMRPADIVSVDVKHDIALLRIPTRGDKFSGFPTAHFLDVDTSQDNYFAYAYPVGVDTPTKLAGDDFKWTNFSRFVAYGSDPIPGIDYDDPVIEIYSSSKKGVSGAFFFDETTQRPLGMAILSSKHDDITALVPWRYIENAVGDLKP